MQNFSVVKDEVSQEGKVLVVSENHHVGWSIDYAYSLCIWHVHIVISAAKWSYYC